MMHGEDAGRRGINDGETVRVFNDIGALRVEVSVCEEIMPGVVCLSAGAWPELTGKEGISGGCPNVLTSTEPTLPSESSRTHSVGVEVEKA